MKPAPLEADFCPECGGAPTIIRHSELIHICCDCCTFYVAAETMESALEKWNSYERYEL